jgi:hypothetical protein
VLLTKRLTIIPLFAAISIFSCQEPLSVKTQEQLNISLGLIEKKVPTEHLILESSSLVPKTKNSTENGGDGMLALGYLKMPQMPLRL